ncbi:MAG: tetratricopeptide repeat protein [Deinococcales bacterium]
MRKLAQSNPDAFLPDLAISLNNLGNMYSDLGQRSEALKATERAVAIREKLAQSNPDAFLPDLAMSLNNLGIRYSNLGQRSEALKATERAVAIKKS